MFNREKSISCGAAVRVLSPSQLLSIKGGSTETPPPPPPPPPPPLIGQEDITIQ